MGKATRGAAVALLMKVLMYEAKPGVLSDKWEEVVKLGKYMVDGTPMTYADMIKWNGNDDWETIREQLWFKPKAKIIGNATGEYEAPNDLLPPVNNVYSLSYTDYYGNPLHNGDK